MFYYINNLKCFIFTSDIISPSSELICYTSMSTPLIKRDVLMTACICCFSVLFSSSFYLKSEGEIKWKGRKDKQEQTFQVSALLLPPFLYLYFFPLNWEDYMIWQFPITTTVTLDCIFGDKGRGAEVYGSVIKSSGDSLHKKTFHYKTKLLKC